MHPSDSTYYTGGKVVALDWLEKDPVPLVLSTDLRPADAPAEPKSVRDLVRLGTAEGWNVLVGYSLGQARQTKKGLYKTVHTFGVWSGVHPGTGWRWCAMYEWSPDLKTPWKWDRTAIWMPGGAPVAPGLGTRFVDANVTDLKEFLRVSGGVGPAWFKGVHARVMEQAEAQKAKTKSATGKTKEGAS